MFQCCVLHVQQLKFQNVMLCVVVLEGVVLGKRSHMTEGVKC